MSTKNEGLEAMVEKNMKTAVILPDIHVPYHDKRAVDLVVKYIKDTKPEVVVQLGDMYDCYGISRFDKNPKRIDTLQDEIDEGKKIWQAIKKASPKSKLVMLEGNHEARLPKMLMKASPGMYSLNALRPKRLFELDTLGVEWYSSHDTYKLNNSLVITHGAADDGCKLSQHAGYSAKNTMDKWGNVSGIMGHGHRVGMSTKTMQDGTMVQWIEAGCLADLHPEYVKNPNWQHGFAVVNYTKNRFHATPIVIANYEFISNGKVYKG